ncbi:MAG: T9SS type A sorting domain-containing protein [Bacteroidota bacterium]
MYNFYNHKSLALLVAMICTFSLSAQFILTVETPDGELGPYDAVAFTAFGTADPCGGDITGSYQVVTDAAGATLACDTITEDLSGTIALIDRGSCNFSLKAFYGTTAGADAVIICQNTGDAPFAGAAGDFADQVTVPVFMIGRDDCAAFRDLDGTLTLTTSTTQFDPRDQVLWGAAGEGSFDGGLGDWTTVNYSECAADTLDDFKLFQWTTSSTQGAYGSGSINSPTACNGSVAFDSDFFDNDGIAGNFGAGLCAAPQAGALISPTIDISGSADAAGVAVSFYQISRQFQSTYWVGWSTDDGATWDSLQINQDFETNAAPSDEFERVNLPNTVIGASNLRVKFVMDPANYYYWVIDDVRIVEREANNLALTDFFAIPPNAITPQSQVEPFGFLADIQNLGALDQAASTLNVTIFGPDDEIAYTQDLTLDAIASDSLLENQVLETGFTPEAIGLYRGVYTVSLDADDFDEEDNQQEFFFFVSDTTLAKEYAVESGEALTSILVDFEQFPTWAYGNYYYLPAGDGYQVNSMTFGIGNVEEVAGLDVTLAIFEWSDTNEDFDAQGDERQLIGFASYEITGEEADNAPITVDLSQEEILLKDDQSYIAMVVANGPIQITASSGTFAYLPTSTLTSADGAASTRYGGFIGLSNDLEAEDYEPDFVFVPFVRLGINTVNVNTEDVLSVEHGMNLFPNPASTQLTLDISLEQAAEQVDVRIYNMSGQLMQQERFQNVQTQQFNYNVGNLANGAYLMEVTTDFGVRTLKFEVAR